MYCQIYTCTNLESRILQIAAELVCFEESSPIPAATTIELLLLVFVFADEMKLMRLAGAGKEMLELDPESDPSALPEPPPPPGVVAAAWEEGARGGG